MPKTLPPLLAEIGRFLAAGVGNTLLTIAIYQLAVGLTGPLVAYAIAWAIGISLVMWLYPRLVFRRNPSWQDSSGMGLIYVLAFAIGCGVTVACTYLGIAERAIVVIAAATTSLFTYVCGRRLGALLARSRPTR
jgi:putative flippase GtrA